jgi:hypothetical protein
MVANPTIKQANELLTFYVDQYKAQFGKPPFLNKAVAKWAARDLIDSFGLDQCKQAVRWYFKVSKRHEWNHFVNVAGSCITESTSVENDKIKRAENRRIANEWRNKS